MIQPIPSEAHPSERDLVPVAESTAMREVLRALDEVASTPTTVLLLGPPGCGRARLGRYLHQRSGRGGSCAEVRCDLRAARVVAALPTAFAEAAGGTILLREVGALAGAAQSFLVRELEEQQGTGAPRVVATASLDLAGRVRSGAFRSELFYRLNVFPVTVPSLTDRPEDLAGLAASLLREDWANGPVPELAGDALEALRLHPFPGEVPELARLLRRARGMGSGRITAADLFGAQPPRVAVAFPAALPLDLAALERLAIEEALRRAGGNRTQAARLLHIGLRTLRNKLRAWRAAGQEVPPPPGPRQELPVLGTPGADETAAILAPRWARRSQERPA